MSHVKNSAKELALDLFTQEAQNTDLKGDHEIEIMAHDEFIQVYSQISPFYIIIYWDKKLHNNFDFEKAKKLQQGKKRIKRKMFYWYTVYLLMPQKKTTRKFRLGK